MHTHRHFLRAAALAVLALAGASALAEVPGGSQIYQQRGADGSIVLTDRPSPKAVTERTWQTQHETLVVARDQEIDVGQPCKPRHRRWVYVSQQWNT